MANTQCAGSGILVVILEFWGANGVRFRVLRTELCAGYFLCYG